MVLGGSQGVLGGWGGYLYEFKEPGGHCKGALRGSGGSLSGSWGV